MYNIDSDWLDNTFTKTTVIFVKGMCLKQYFKTPFGYTVFMGVIHKKTVKCTFVKCSAENLLH